MIDLDELERLVAQMAPGTWVAPRVDVSTPAQGTSAPYALCITGQGPRMFTVDRCRYMHADDAAGIAALRNAAEELILDARRWREHEELMMRFVRSEEGM
jgi:hypothetical protein